MNYSIPAYLATKDEAILFLRHLGFTRHIGPIDLAAPGEYFGLPGADDRLVASCSRIGVAWKVDGPILEEVVEARAIILAKMVEEVAKASLSAVLWAKVESGEAGLDDVCDGNMVYAAAFRKMNGDQPMAMDERLEREETFGQDEVLSPAQTFREDFELRIWNAAVDIFQQRATPAPAPATNAESPLERAARSQEEGRTASREAARAALAELEATAETFAALAQLPGAVGVVEMARRISLSMTRDAEALRAIICTAPQ